MTEGNYAYELFIHFAIIVMGLFFLMCLVAGFIVIIKISSGPIRDTWEAIKTWCIEKYDSWFVDPVKRGAR